MLVSGLHVVVRGAGAPVVLLHSGGMSSRQWRKLMDALASASPSWRALAPDLLGSGDNPPWPDDAPFEHALDVAAVLAVVAAEGRPVDLVGHSYGGLVALTLAREHPELVRSMVLYDPVAFGVLHSADRATAADAEALADLARVAADPAFVDPALGGTDAWMLAFVDYWNGAGTWRATPAAGREAFLRVGKKVSYEVRSIMADRTPREAYAGITAPTLLLSGEHTPLAARQVTRVLCDALPHAQRREVPGAGHMGPITHAELVNRWILEHLALGEHEAEAPTAHD